MNKKTLWITETAVMLALLIALQWTTSYIPKPVQQYITGSCVNTVLAVAVLLCGMESGFVVAMLSPVFAFFLGIAGNPLVVPVIMVGNLLFVLLLGVLSGKPFWKNILAWLTAAAAKFAAMYALVAWGLGGILMGSLTKQGFLTDAKLVIMQAQFSWPQLVTALIGGGIALLLVPVLKKALHRV